jgi:hypothetical protein
MMVVCALTFCFVWLEFFLGISGAVFLVGSNAGLRNYSSNVSNVKNSLGVVSMQSHTFL